jgi:protein-L-isoaspartate(D-aspartate) O-methyltransferase
MVDGQLRVGGVADLAVLAAFLDTPREAFVAPAQAGLAYLDCDQPALGSSGRRLLAPLTLARLLQAAAVAPGERALDVAGGSGYSAAILEQLGARVVALESDAGAAEAARRALAGRAAIEVVEGDLLTGARDRGPFDVILVNGAYESRPDALIAQLAEGGRFVGVEAQPGAEEAVLVEKSAAGISQRTLFETRAAAIEAFRRAPSFAF